jgi:predicted helicase
MTSEIAQYIADVNRAYQTGNATEHTYRPALQNLLESIAAAQSLSQLKNLQFTNEPKLIDCGRPDFIVTRNDARIGYIETKDIGIDLNGKACKAQFDRYKQSLSNIIFTDYLDFHRYINGEFAESVRVAEIKDDKITPIKANFGRFEQLFIDFGTAQPQNITAPAEIAKMMAGKARLLAENIEKSLGINSNDNDLTGIMAAFKQVLIHNLTGKEFADVYAQTIAYGLFAARLHDESPDTFCRQKAASLIPKTNPFLRQLFNTIAGFDLDAGIGWLVDDLAETLRAANMAGFKKNFGEQAAQNDPIVYFYEDFLSEYNPALRNSRGVYYTPQPVVSFIVRAVDEILQNEFKLPMGLADTAKTRINVKNSPIDVHRVQILDPAAGTGTFLAETVNHIHGKYKNQAGVWQSYVKEHLIPRLNGFELLMAPYTIAHIKLELLLSQTGYEATDNQRLRIYLTNSLEEEHPETGTLFAQFLAREANEANGIKRDAPIMVVMGNPPYSGESQNKGDWIALLMEDYKKEPPADFTQQEKNPVHWLEVHEQSAVYLQERSSKWINDDYCKFIRLGQYFVDKNNEGILAYINNHGFLDNPTFRGMRWSLLKSFDRIYILDLHGNARKKEVCPDGSKDENVFDIQQGVSINIFVKTGKKKYGELAEVYHLDLYGKRTEKYDYLTKNKFSKVPFTKLAPSAPEFFFVPKDYGAKEEYDKGFGVQELFPVNSVGIVTARDNFTVHHSAQAVKKTIHEFMRLDIETARDRFALGKDARDWSVEGAKNDLTSGFDLNKIVEINYRPFDKRYTYYTGNSKGFHCMPRGNVMRHFLNGENVGLVTIRRSRSQQTWNFISVCNCMVSGSTAISSLDINYVFPLYLYPDPANPVPGETRKPNLDAAIVAKISARTGLRFVDEEIACVMGIAGQARNDGVPTSTFAPINVLDYIYAVLHSPQYRERYKEFLKIDFPRVPYPAGAKQFRSLAKTGEKLRKLHLLDGVEPQDGIADFQIPGGNEVEKILYEPGVGKTGGGRVYINNRQYFNGVPPEAWNFYIGGYQPVYKWLKDRKGTALAFDGIRHYQKIIRVLAETARLMGEIEV